MAITIQQQRTIRQYAASDQARVLEICKNVYGGTDYLPRLIHHFAEQPDIDLLVSEDAGHVHGVVGGSRRGSSIFLFGLRVCESARGTGVARKLMEAMCEQGMKDSSISTITSATTPDNAAANRIFQALGFHHSHTVDLWPAYSALGEYEAAVGFVPGQSPAPPPGQITMLDFIPGVRDLASQASSQLGVGVDDWMCCSSMLQLHEAVVDVRKQQLRHPELQQLPPDTPLEWLPWVYESQPLDGKWTLEQVQAGRVWLLGDLSADNNRISSTSSSSAISRLPGSSGLLTSASMHHISSFTSTSSSWMNATADVECSSSGAAEGAGNVELGAAAPGVCQAVVVLTWSPEFRRMCAGILTAGDAYLPAALELIFSKVPHCVCMCDRGTRHSSGSLDPAVELPDVCKRTGSTSCFIVYSRQAQQ